MDYVNSGHVTAYGPGLIHGMVNKPAVFTVNTKDAGEGTVSCFFHTPGICLWNIFWGWQELGLY